ncbi:MAG: bifunctional phosphoglucose/phosphomannose isomerase [Actinomycetota bacterium]|nr:bifunctional phosphoglucose/phosphomannose isomerase [Actinomycetota bacterium]
MIEDVLAQPDQIAEALWRVEAADIPSRDLPGGLHICGMGGSAVGGDLAAAAIGRRATRPVRTVRGYAPEPWLGPDTLVLCSSYSGETQETLACFEAAGRAGAPRVALTTGGPLAARAREEGVPVIGVPSGMRPRAAVVFMTVGALECAALCGAGPALRDEIEAAAPTLEGLAQDPEADDIARRLHGTLAVIHGVESTVAPAWRWKAQFNENAKLAAFASSLPEANHNEIEGWPWLAERVPSSAVYLTAPGHAARLTRQVEVAAEALGNQGVSVVWATARGEGGVAQVLSLVMLGDLVSLRLAELRDVDPTPVAAIEGLKASLD